MAVPPEIQWSDGTFQVLQVVAHDYLLYTNIALLRMIMVNNGFRIKILLQKQNLSEKYECKKKHFAFVSNIFILKP